MASSLSRFRVEGFRSLKNIDLSPGRITVLIGPNGAGKSNLLAALRLLPLLRTQSLRRFVGEQGGASALLHYGQRVTRELKLNVDFESDSGPCSYTARLAYAAGDSLSFIDETVGIHATPPSESLNIALPSAGRAESGLTEQWQDAAMSRAAAQVGALIARVSFFHFHDTSLTSELRSNSRQEDAGYLRSNGSNLAAYLRALEISSAETSKKAWRRITSLVQRVAPFIKVLKPTLVDPLNVATSAVRLDWIDERDELFGPHHLSDGTLRAIALITAMAQPGQKVPHFISIDEPELGLHPAALAVIAALIKSISTQSQVLLATQSPTLLDYFEPADVVVSELEGGVTTLRRLDPSELASWLEEYRLSEIYEKNLIGGRP